MKWLMMAVILSALHTSSVSQPAIVDTSLDPAFKNAVTFYNNSFGPELRLFNGKEYHEYLLPFKEGQPYFFSNIFSKGTVSYEGKTYENVSILYNLVTDQVVILKYSGFSKIQLLKERVDAFSLSGHYFINIQNGSLSSPALRPGFYDIVASGKVSLLVKRTKRIQTDTKETVEIKVLSKDHFFLRNKNVYSEVDTKNAFLKQLKAKRKEIQQFIKQNGIRYRKNPEEAMVRILEYYNQIMK